MYEETLKRKPLRGFKSFLLIIGLVFFILALMFIVGYLQYIWQISYLQYILFGGVIVFGIIFVRMFLTEYVYMIAEDRVQIYRKIGSRPKLLIEFPFRDMRSIGTRDEISGLKGQKKVKLTFKKEDGDTCYILLAGDVALVLNPTDVFWKKLKELYEKTNR
jgi:hypothetical protein